MVVMEIVGFEWWWK